MGNYTPRRRSCADKSWRRAKMDASPSYVIDLSCVRELMLLGWPMESLPQCSVHCKLTYSPEDDSFALHLDWTSSPFKITEATGGDTVRSTRTATGASTGTSASSTACAPSACATNPAAS